MTVDISDLDDFIKELHESAKEAVAESRKCVTKGAHNIQMDARKTLRSQLSGGGRRSSLDWLPGAISYDITSGDGITEAEIGPDQSISGLGVGTEFGSIHHAPMPFLHPALDKEEPKFAAAIEAAVSKAFKL